MRSQGLSDEVERLSRKLEKAEAELKAATDSLKQSQSRIESLSQRLKKSECLLQSEKRRGSSETEAVAKSHSDEPNKTNTSQTQGAPTVDQPRRDGEGHDLSVTPDDATAEPERPLIERLIELEREVNMSL